MLKKLIIIIGFLTAYLDANTQGLGVVREKEYRPLECTENLKQFGDGMCYDLQTMYSGSYFWFGHDSTFIYIFYGEGAHKFGAGNYSSNGDTLYLASNADYAKQLIETGKYKEKESYFNPKYARIIKSEAIICTPTENGGYHCKF